MSRYSIAVQVTLLWLAAIVAAQNPLISDGTCYFAANKQANAAYIPCGNSAFGVYSCCLEGDVCLSSNACYNSKYGDTYLAGCTDSTYKDASCPYKGVYAENQWASLVRCFVSNDTLSNKEQWAVCNEAQPLVTTPSGGCVCNAAAKTAVFTDNPSLTNHAVLPTNTGLSISWVPGFTPATTLKPTKASTTSSSTSSSSSASSTSSSYSSSSTSSNTITTSSTSSSTAGAQGASTTGSSTSSSTSASATSSPNGLSVGAEVGIGLGIGLGVLAICAVLFLLYRRRVKKRQGPTPPDPTYSAVPHTSPYADDKVPWTPSANTQTTPRPDGRAAPWGGYKSELSGDTGYASQSNRVSMPPSELATSESSRPWSQSNTSMGQRLSPDAYDSAGNTMISHTSGSGSAGARDSQGVSLMSNWNTTNPNLNVRDPRLQNPTIHELSG